MAESDKRNLAQLIVQHLKHEMEHGQMADEAVESLEISIQCIEQAYKLDEIPVKLATNTSLRDLYNKANIQREPVSTDDKQNAEKHKTDGNDFMKVENYQQAVTSYTQAIRIDGNNAVYYCNRAAAYTAMQNFNNAIADCEQAIKIDPTYGKAYGRMGLACINAKEYEKAASAYKHAVDLEPNNTSYKQNMDLANERATAEKQQQAPPPAAGPNLGGLDLSSLLNNPAVMNMAQSFMQNPQMQNMFANMMGGMQPPNLADGAPAGAPAAAPQPEARPTQTQGEPTAATSDDAADFRAQTGINPPAGMDMNAMLGATQNFAEQMRATNPDLVEQLRQQFNSGGGGDDTPPPTGQ